MTKLKMWFSGIERRFTAGNLVTIIIVILTWSIAGAVWYTQVDSHLKDSEIHPTLKEQQAITDSRIHLLMDPTVIETNRRLGNIEKSGDENTKLLHEIKGQLEAK